MVGLVKRCLHNARALFRVLHDEVKLRACDPIMYAEGIMLTIKVKFGVSSQEYVQSGVIRGTSFCGIAASIASLKVDKDHLDVVMSISLTGDFLARSESCKMSSDYYRLMKGGIGADITLKIKGGYTMKIHSTVLLARCPAFRNEAFCKMEHHTLDWSTYPRSSCKRVIRYLYCGALNDLSSTDLGVVALALELQIHHLAFYQVAKLQPKTPEQVKDIHALAAAYNKLDPHAVTTLGQVGRLLASKALPLPTGPPTEAASALPPPAVGCFATILRFFGGSC